MANQLDEPTVRVHVHFYKRDIERIEALFGHRLKRAEAVRQLVRQMLDRIEAQAQGQAQALPAELELDLGGAP